MTSKEGIEIAKKAVIVAKKQRQNELSDEDNEWFDSNIKALEQAEKDLEVLEIIKVNHFEIDKDGNVYVGNICDVLLGIEDYYKDMEEEYNKIKEWLINNK